MTAYVSGLVLEMSRKLCPFHVCFGTIRIMFKRKQKVVERKIINTGQVIIPTGHPNPPEPHEISTAWILARHYNTSVQFLIPVDDYKRKSADIVMLGVEWEMKSPVGASKSTIENQFRRASKQARYIIIDTRRTSLDDVEIEKAVIRETKKHLSVKKVILVGKSEKVVEMSI